MNAIKAVLFDLDGTLLDTTPDLVSTLNLLRNEHGLPDLPMTHIRPLVSQGSKAMVKKALAIDETHPHFHTLREKFLALYQERIAIHTTFFPQMDAVLTHLEQQQIPWGIVTNKLTQHTHALLKALELYHRPACIICGDTLSKCKPHPEPILHACQLLNLKPTQCLYVGDAKTDVLASKAAGTKSLVALYGYISSDEDPISWNADGYIHTPIELINWIKQCPHL